MSPPVAQEMSETQVQYLGWEDLLDKGMATQFSILAWRIPMEKGDWWATVHGVTAHKGSNVWERRKEPRNKESILSEQNSPL